MVRSRPTSSTTAAPRRRRRPPTGGPGDGGVATDASEPREDESVDTRGYSNGANGSIPERLVDVADLTAMAYDQLLDLAPEVGFRDESALTELGRDALLQKIRLAAANRNMLTASGVLEVMDAGHGLLRSMQYPPVNGDVFVGSPRFGVST